MRNIDIYTTTAVEGRKIRRYHGVVSSQVVMGTKVIKDMFAGFRTFEGGRVASYEKELAKAREIAIEQLKQDAAALGANAVLALHVDTESISSGGNHMLVVCAEGTAVEAS